MTKEFGEHLSGTDLENYSLGRIVLPRSAALEQHLLVCSACRADLQAIEPYNFVHYTRDGPFYSRITKLRSGELVARHWGKTIEGGKTFRTRAGAKAYLVRSFARIFPEHVCTRRCGSSSVD
ncbi:MAG: hypothetical protein ACLP59_33105 [Bryobacteraceae bacterium]